MPKSSLAEFQLQKKRTSPFVFVYGNKRQKRETQTTKRTKSQPIISKSVDCTRRPDQLDDAIFRKYLASLCSQSALLGFGLGFPGLVSPNDAYIYDAFVNGFMVAVSTQLTHERLQPGAVFIPHGAANPWLLDVFYACGAAFLAANRKDMRELAESRMAKVMGQFQQIAARASSDSDSKWLVVALLSLSLREKFYGLDGHRTVLFLRMAFQLIRNWPKTRLANRRHLEVLPEDIRPVVSDQHWLLTPIERTLVESFAYNYSVIGLVLDQKSQILLDSPFEVFDELQPLLDQQLYKCPAPWMNNPVMGAALPAFELASKAGWLQLQYPFNESMRHQAIALFRLAKYFVPPVLPADVRFSQPKHVCKRLLDSCLAARIVAQGAYILLYKMLYPETLEIDSDIQRRISDFINDLEQLSFHSSISAILTWPFSIIGTAIVEKDQRDYMLWRLRNFGYATKNSCFESIVEFLNRIWDAGLGWQALLDKTNFDKLFI
ncbi:hypothetical protein KL942_003766 [Ogataea angusta]|uniref:Transcription factor domain-containing protein n=1 Tax=Pichia angusta TaxID=870730 RepID=A0ABQ7RWU8_PICAN|nr:hypothetical protein KL942_003766 [Ogataea angusta]KAG7849486.1 hypothetical protein KL940_002516 [Ogataea angusta]